MLPIPILILLSIVALFVYLGIGAVVGVIGTHIMDGSLKPLATGDDYYTFGWFAALWPLALVVGLAVAVFWGPIWVCAAIGRYLAGAQTKEIPRAT